MPFLQFKTGRRTREKIFRAKAVLSLAIWLTMTAAEICPPLHAWLHGRTVPKDDCDCAIVAIAHGKIEVVACDVPVVLPVTWIEAAPRVEFSVFIPAHKNLLLGRGPRRGQKTLFRRIADRRQLRTQRQALLAGWNKFSCG